MKLSIIIPVYNEKNFILEVIKKIHAVSFPDEIKEFEIVVVDDFSKDGTTSILEKNKQNLNYNLVILTQNSGKGYAIREGIKKSTGDIIIIQDADFELIPDDMPLMLKTMFTLNVEFVNGSRYMTGIIRPLYSYRRYFFNKMFTKFASILINVRLTDLACGYKLFSRNIYNQIILKENRFGFEAEFLIKIARLKKTLIAEVPVHYFPREIEQGKKIKNIDGLKIMWTILKYSLFTKAKNFKKHHN